MLEEWLKRITGELAEYKAKHPEKKVAPFAVNQIVHSSNDRLQHDIDMCEKYKVPIQITSLRAPDDRRRLGASLRLPGVPRRHQRQTRAQGALSRVSTV
jgi:NAD(P)H-dependent flavin oxidoreductase YrpB (nitropropane dioxygenase family)